MVESEGSLGPGEEKAKYGNLAPALDAFEDFCRRHNFTNLGPTASEDGMLVRTAELGGDLNPYIRLTAFPYKIKEGNVVSDVIKMEFVTFADKDNKMTPNTPSVRVQINERLFGELGSRVTSDMLEVAKIEARGIKAEDLTIEKNNILQERT
ncbi:MAG: hypothetical protein ACD_50C00019G0011 [uncultured bacterium]|nr:MAG: hypothetical protein ACD_50C00019G0011 [uncultured bacterium]